MTDYLRHPDWLALVRGVCEEPESDLRRLVAADWLEENGDGERAEFIREHVEYRYRHTGGVGLAVIGGPAGGPVVVAPATPGVAWTVGRGFVSGVTLSQAALLGGGCDRCGGSGRLAIHGRTHGDCLTCDGTGRTPGLAASLFGAHPITAVTLSDVGTVQSFNGWHFARWPDGFTVDLQLYETTYLIRDPLWSAELIVSLRSSAEAHAALSRRCIAYGRHAAGLTPLCAPVDAIAPAR